MAMPSMTHGKMRWHREWRPQGLLGSHWRRWRLWRPWWTKMLWSDDGWVIYHDLSWKLCQKTLLDVLLQDKTQFPVHCFKLWTMDEQNVLPQVCYIWNSLLHTWEMAGHSENSVVFFVKLLYQGFEMLSDFSWWSWHQYHDHKEEEC